MASPEVVRVVSYNLHKLSDDRASLISVLTALRPDILIAQEAPTGVRWRPRCAALLREAGMFYAAGGGGAAAGNLIGVSMRTEVVATTTDSLPTPRLTQNRGLAGAVVTLGALRVAVVGTHFDLDPARRRDHADRVLTRATTFAAEFDAPLVVAADTNETPDQPVWATLGQAGLHDYGTESGMTIPTVGPDRRIDVVLVGAGLRVLDYRVGTAALDDQPGDDQPAENPQITGATFRAASDHLPVLARISRDPDPVPAPARAARGTARRR
jgi:endonuclease/exonuclease/phosphatase family metal-dependent hydrolase